MEPLTRPPHPSEPSRSTIDDVVTTVAIILPTVVTWVYFVQLAGAPAIVQQSAYLVGKAIQFGSPIVWIAWLRRGSLPVGFPKLSGLVAGSILGLAIAGAMGITYAAWLKPSGFFENALPLIRGKVDGMGLESTAKYLAVSLFYSFGHSGLEEYYWRWFVYGLLRRNGRLGQATVVSSVGFMAHHVIVLATYFGWSNPATWLFSGGVATGGLLWAWLYERQRTIAGPWISHLWVDAAIFAIGYDLLVNSH